MSENSQTKAQKPQSQRAHNGGSGIDRGKRLAFRFDGRQLYGYQGDTLASALLANNVHLVNRSFKYHRPRGIYTAGVEEPNALIQLRKGSHTEPNVRATQIELFGGLDAESQNRWPNLHFDTGAANNILAPLLPAGFYNKTFMWPPKAWLKYEHVIRRAAGLGRAPAGPDPDVYARRYAHCEILVIGSGAAGLMAARSAAKSGARIILVEERSRFGGELAVGSARVGEQSGVDFVTSAIEELAAMDNVRLLSRSTAFGYYDQNMVMVCERVTDHLPQSPAGQPRQRIWWIRAGKVILATGSIERPMVFGGNDLPGVMLAGAARRYAREFAVRPGNRAIVFTNNDSGYETVSALTEAGVNVAAVIDVRRDGPGAAARAHLDGSNAELILGWAVYNASGGRRITGVELGQFDGRKCYGSSRSIDCDFLCVSGGWSPTVHLFSQSQGKLRYDDTIAAFVPGISAQNEVSVGAACGAFKLADCLAQGVQAAADACREAGLDGASTVVPQTHEAIESPISPVWDVKPPQGVKVKRFVDFQNDVKADDIELAHREGFESVEHLKRYTTLGMGTDQGRTSNINGLAIMAELRGTEIPRVGTTTFRPPFSPTCLGAMAGTETGHHFMPLRRTALHHWHLDNGATMVNVGAWQRAQYYQKPGESMMDAIYREAKHVRRSVGVVDVSTLGKIEIRGRDAAEFLDRVYVNKWSSLKVGKARYGFMLREDGFIEDDGTTTRVAEDNYYMTTTTAHAASVMANLEYYSQTQWPELHVHLTSITDQWAGVALAGPHSRDVLAVTVDGADVSNEALPYVGFIDTTIAGTPVRVLRITFSGELAYEIHMPADHAVHVWEALMAAGQAHDITPYGTEAMNILRLEKGHVTHAEIDGRVTVEDFGFGRMMKADKDFIGKRATDRPGLKQNRKTLVGLMSVGREPIPRGSQIVEDPGAPKPVRMLGHVSSRCYSPNIDAEIGLGFVENGESYKGKTLYAASPLSDKYVKLKVQDPVFYDPEGGRARG